VVGIDGDSAKPYAITGAPRIAKGMVIIGNAGSEYGVRGYISAFDAETGKMVWRFYTVPATLQGVRNQRPWRLLPKPGVAEWWKAGGGGTPWEGIVYDPSLDLLVLRTGNPTAWYRRSAVEATVCNRFDPRRARQFGRTRLALSNHPGDNWDFDATQPLMQADLTIGGRARKVIMQANKNGFFYVLDRETGEFISASRSSAASLGLRG